MKARSIGASPPEMPLHAVVTTASVAMANTAGFGIGLKVVDSYSFSGWLEAEARRGGADADGIAKQQAYNREDPVQRMAEAMIGRAEVGQQARSARVSPATPRTGCA
ncbi:MAG: hypothetical protein WKH68_11390 [Candidatus Limnocylindria bacterium]